MDNGRRAVLSGLGLAGAGAASLGAGLAGLPGSAGAGQVARDQCLADVGPPARPGRDQTRELQAALDRAAAHGRALVLQPGRFSVESLRLPDGASIKGAGSATALVQRSASPVLTARGAADLEIAGLAVMGGRDLDAMRGLVELDGCRDVVIEDVTVTASLANGIILRRATGRVRDCRIDHCAGAGLWSTDAAGLDIGHNRISDCGNNGILVWQSKPGQDGTLIQCNRIERIAAHAGGTGQNGNGINVFRAGNVLVQGNWVSDCAYSAIRGNAASGLQVVANTALRSGEVAIYAEFAFEAAVISSNVIDGAATGISVTNFADGGRLAVVQGNLVRNLRVRRGGPYGSGVFVEADAAVSGNVVEGAPRAGIEIGHGKWCRDVVASGNVARQCGVGIAVSGASAAGPVLLAQNLVSGATQGAVRLTDHGRMIGPDLTTVTDGTSSGRRVTLHGNVVA